MINNTALGEIMFIIAQYVITQQYSLAKATTESTTILLIKQVGITQLQSQFCTHTYTQQVSNEFNIVGREETSLAIEFSNPPPFINLQTSTNRLQHYTERCSRLLLLLNY